jgi:hypothetical protein
MNFQEISEGHQSGQRLIQFQPDVKVMMEPLYGQQAELQPAHSIITDPLPLTADHHIQVHHTMTAVQEVLHPHPPVSEDHPEEAHLVLLVLQEHQLPGDN